MGLYENIKKAAELRHKSINQIEVELSLPRSSIAKYNAHVPSADKIATIAKYLDVSTDSLLGIEEQEVVSRINFNLSAMQGKGIDVFKENRENDPVFMEHIRLLWSLSPTDRKEIYSFIEFKYYGSKKRDSRSLKEV